MYTSIYTYIHLDYTCEEKVYLYFWVWPIFNNIIFLSFSFFCSFIHSFFFHSGHWLLSDLHYGGALNIEMRYWSLVSTPARSVFSTPQPWPRPRAGRCLGNRPALNGSAENCLTKASGSYKKRRKAWDGPFPGKMRASHSASFFLPTHGVGRYWFIWIPQACRRARVASRQWLGDAHCYLVCIRLSDWNSKNSSRGAKALQVPGREWVLHPGWQGQPSLALTEQEEKGSQE